jgi:tRNA modification GTPase
VKLCALTGEGVDILKRLLVEHVAGRNVSTSDSSVTVTNARHQEALRKSIVSLELAMRSLQDGQNIEFISVDLRSGLDFLGEITGAVTSEDILNNIFSKFCIGK